MRFHFRLIAFLFLLFHHLLADGQLKYGQIVGLNLSSLSLNRNEISYSPRISPGIHFGGYLEIPVARHLQFRPALVFSAKGASFRTDSSTFSISPIYAEIPASLFLTFGPGEIKVVVFAGVYVACGVGGNTLESKGPFKNIVFGNGPGDDIKRFDLGYNSGAGINFGEFLVSVQYGSSLVNESPSEKKNTEMKNKVTGISLSFAMTPKK
ncbi:MAG TPA: outer membrane beta-barrel protein [Bacteroidales bacterium]|nr:outer membrane beta-barrel protein [Bacteroidales bacterium]